jgi:hypothetical protein
MSGGKTEVIDGVVRNGEWMEVDLTDAEVLARLYWFNSITKCFASTLRLVVSDIETFANVSLQCLT